MGELDHGVHAARLTISYWDALGNETRFLNVAINKFSDAMHEGVRKAFIDLPFAPCEIGFVVLRALSAIILSKRKQPLGWVGVAIEHHVLARFAQFCVEIIIDGHLAGIDDAHIHPCLNGMEKKNGMHGFAHRVVAAERERQVRDAS